MAKFNQKNQTVYGSQYNADTIQIGEVNNRVDLVTAIERVRAEIENALAANAIDAGTADIARDNLTNALVEARSETPSRGKLTAYLNGAKGVLTGAAGAASIVLALSKLAELADQVFGR